jgi:uncharacterized protein (DUF1330 family)
MHTGEKEPMKTNYKLSLVALVGVTIGVVGATAIHARQVKPPSPVYLISEVDAMDLNGIQKYGEKVPGTLVPFNGHYHFLVAGAKPQALDREPPKGIVVIAFDSAEKAREWYDSPAYEAIKPIRLSSSRGRMFIVEGVAPQ